MGCCGSSMTNQLPAAWYAQFKAIRLTDSEIKKFLKLYQTIDHDRSGAVDLLEMLDYLDIENTSFSRRAFSVFDLNESGKIDFREFVLSLWNYCTLGHATLDVFTFDIYDNDKSGQLSRGEVEKMLKDLYGKGFQSNQRAHNVINEIKKIGDFDLIHFTKFAKTHQEMLFPAFQMQLKIQEKVFGRSFWDRCSNRRIELSKGKYVSIVEIMQMHVSPELFDKMTKGKGVLPSGSIVLQTTGTAHDRQHGKKKPQPAGAGHLTGNGEVLPSS